MKKITVTLFLFLTLISGCGGNEKPNGLSDEMYESAIYAIKAVDLYLDAESTIEETKENWTVYCLNMKVLMKEILIKIYTFVKEWIK